METLKLNSNDAMRYAIGAMGGDRVDKGGNPYVMHLAAVVTRLEGMAGTIGIPVTDEMRQAAILHDTVEDTDASLEDLLHYGFSDEVVRLVDALTHRPKESKRAYWRRIVDAGPEARAIKAADACDNQQLARLNRAPEQIDMVRSMIYGALVDYMINPQARHLLQCLGYLEAYEALAKADAARA